MILRRCNECQLVYIEGYRCEHCGELVCDDCAIEHPCNWHAAADSWEDGSEIEEEEEEDD